MYTIVEDIVCDFLIRELRAFQVTGVMKTWNKLCEAVEKSSINECTYSLNSRSNSFSKVFRENGGNMFREHKCVPFSFFPLPYGLTNLRKRNFIIWGAWLPPLSSVWTGKFVTKQSNTHTHTLNRMVLFAFVLRSRVHELTSVELKDNCWQESFGFLTARGGKKKISTSTGRC